MDSVDFSSHVLSPAEKRVVQGIYQYPEILANAARQLSPALMAGYAYDLAKSFNHFYHDHVIVEETDPVATSFRLNLARTVAEVIRESMRLLGIRVPERM